ncbi:MAG: bacteriohemerythrin [Sedimenticola sp.]
MDEIPWKIEWSDALSMRNAEIDAEHKHFIDLVNRLNAAIRERQDKAQVEQIMELILEDAREHFKHEERLFAEKAFPGAGEHSAIHRGLLAGLEEAMAEFRDSDFSYEWIKIGLSIKDQLVQHVLVEDVRYIEYLATD